jgi:hypothetical protein
MIDRASLRIEPVLAASPVWIQLRDTFTGRPPAGPVSVALERRTGATWVALAGRQADVQQHGVGRLPEHHGQAGVDPGRGPDHFHTGIPTQQVRETLTVEARLGDHGSANAPLA